MGTRSGRDRRENPVGPLPGHRERRQGPDRRRLHLTDETFAEVEAQLATLTKDGSDADDGDDGDGSGWDKLIIPVK